MHPSSVYTWTRQVLALAMMVGLYACGGGPPFNSYDPPPSFAFKHTAEYSQVRARYLGSLISGFYQAPAVHPTFTIEGTRYEFSPTLAVFGQWTTIEFARWPANWRFNSVGGCGAATGANITITQKIFETVCTPLPRIPGISPPSVTPNSPGSVTVTFNPAEVPPWTGVEVWIVDPDAQAVMSSTAGQLDGNSSIQVPTPALPEGEYRVLVDINLENSDGGDATLVVGSGGASGRWKSDDNGGCYWDPNDSGPDQCSPPTGRWKSDGNGGCYWDPNDSGPDQCVPPVSFAKGRDVGLPPTWMPFGRHPLTAVGASRNAVVVRMSAPH